MGNAIKGFIAGMIVMAMFSTLVVAESTCQTIEVMLNRINLEIDGVKVSANNILYNGTTYVPVRRVAEILGKEVTWNSETNTVSINSIDRVSEILEKLFFASESVTIGEEECTLKTYLWRDFQPASLIDGKPLIGDVEVVNKDNVDISSKLTFDKIWVVNGQEIWEAELINEGSETQKNMIVRNGPKWGPDIKVDVIIRVKDQSNNEYFIKASNQNISRTD